MTQEEKAKYETTDALRRIFIQLKGMKFRLDCGHYAENEVMRREVSQS